MARRHGGLGRGLDALIPMREEVEKAMNMTETESVEILFADDDGLDYSVLPDRLRKLFDFFFIEFFSRLVFIRF